MDWEHHERNDQIWNPPGASDFHLWVRSHLHHICHQQCPTRGRVFDHWNRVTKVDGVRVKGWEGCPATFLPTTLNKFPYFKCLIHWPMSVGHGGVRWVIFPSLYSFSLISFLSNKITELNKNLNFPTKNLHPIQDTSN